MKFVFSELLIHIFTNKIAGIRRPELIVKAMKIYKYKRVELSSDLKNIFKKYCTNAPICIIL